MSRVQFNLLPQSKMQSVRAARNRRFIITIAFLASAASLAVFLLTLFSVDVIQTKQLSDANKAITDTTAKIKQNNNLDKILTIQNQLVSLASLHQNKHVASRLFNYLPQITPSNVHIGSLNIDFDTGVMSISGTADSPHSVNIFIDTLKFTNLALPGQTTPKSAFPSVIENSYGIGQGNVSFSLTIHFDPSLFSNAIVDSDHKPVSPTLKVPSLTTTRSVLNDPGNAIFNGQNTGGNQQ